MTPLTGHCGEGKCEQLAIVQLPSSIIIDSTGVIDAISSYSICIGVL